MAKKVLIISSSPRKGGNSDILCGEFLRGSLDAGHSAEKIALREKRINPCTGCGFCNSNGNTKCSQNDDMAEILDKMQAADVIVLATPIYFYSVSGQMKTFIDRICARYTRLEGKSFFFIMSAADSSQTAIRHALGDFQGLMECLDNPKDLGYLFAGGVWKMNEVKKTPFPQKAYEAGKNI